MMVVGFGLWGKDVHNLLIKAIQMRFDARHVTKDWKRQNRLKHELDNYTKRHNIEKIQEVEDKLNHTAEDAVVHSHRLVTLDLLILYGIVKYCEKFLRLLMKGESELKRGEKEIKGTMLRVIKKYELEEREVKEKLKRVIEKIKENLQKDRAVVLAIENIAEKKHGVALWAKEAVVVKVRFIRYMAMRFEMVRARKGLQREEKDLRQLMPLLIHLDLIEQMHQKGMTPKRIEEELKEIDEKERDFVKAAEKGSKNVYKLFVNDFLIMRLVILHLYEEEILTIRLAQKNEIPRALAEADVKKKEEILYMVRKRLQEERQDIKQLWGEINSIQV